MPHRAAAITIISVFLFLNLPTIAQAQESEQPTRDPQALAVLTQAVSAAGKSALSVEDFTATGSITYYWAGEEVKGSAVIRGKGAEQFSMEVLPAYGNALVNS